MANILTILKDGAASLATSLTSNGRELTGVLRMTKQKLHMRVKIYGLHLRLTWLHMLHHHFLRRCTRVLTGQRLLKTSPKKKSGSNWAYQNATNCSSYSIKGELPTQQQRLLDQGWVK